MTWFAHNLYMPATDNALKVLRGKPSLLPYLFLVRDLEGYPWYSPEALHDLGPVGLAVVRPIGPTQGYPFDWHQEKVLPWDSLHPTTPNPRLATFVEGEVSPPTSLLQFLKELSNEAGVPVLYHSASSWGGSLEFEASWVFTPVQHTYITHSASYRKQKVRYINEDGFEVLVKGDALRKGLEHLDIRLPTKYFALHTGELLWDRYRFT